MTRPHIFEERITTDDRKTSLEYAIMLKNILEIHKNKNEATSRAPSSLPLYRP